MIGLQHNAFVRFSSKQMYLSLTKTSRSVIEESTIYNRDPGNCLYWCFKSIQTHTVQHRKLKLGMLNPPIGAVVIGYKALTSMASEAGGGHSTLGHQNS